MSAPTSVDLRQRLVELALEPALVLARLSSLPLDDLQQMVATGYFREWRSRGLSLSGIGQRLGKSLRTTATLSKNATRADQRRPASQRVTWRRKLAAHVARKGSVELRELVASIRGAKRAELRAEIDRLVEDGVLALDGDGNVVVSAPHLDLVGEDVDRRLDSLRHLLDAVTRTIYQRFFAREGDGIALARVLTFRANAAELGRLSQKQYDALRKQVVAADDAAGEHAIEASVVLCVVESPSRFPWLPRGQQH